MRSSFRSFAVKCSKCITWWHLQQRVHFKINFLQHPQLIHCCRNMQLSHCCVLSPASSMEWLSRILTRADRVSTLFGIPAFSPCTGHSFLLLLYTPVHKHSDCAEFWRTSPKIFCWIWPFRPPWPFLDTCQGDGLESSTQDDLAKSWRLQRRTISLKIKMEAFLHRSSDIIFLVSCARACGQ